MESAQLCFNQTHVRPTFPCGLGLEGSMRLTQTFKFKQITRKKAILVYQIMEDIDTSKHKSLVHLSESVQ